MTSVSSLGSPVSPRTTRKDSEGLQVAYGNAMEPVQPSLQTVKPPTPSPTAVEPDLIHDEKTEHHARPQRKWTRWIPPKGRVRWAYAALIVLLLVALVVAPVALHEKLKRANGEASKPLLTQPYVALKMPTNTSKLFRDPYNTTGIYMVFPEEDRRGNDIFATMSYTIEACLLACNKYNEFLGSGPTPCIAGTMNYNQEESAIGQRGANCFLKTKAGDDIDNTNPMALGFRLCPSRRCSFNSTG